MVALVYSRTRRGITRWSGSGETGNEPAGPGCPHAEAVGAVKLSQESPVGPQGEEALADDGRGPRVLAGEGEEADEQRQDVGERDRHTAALAASGSWVRRHLRGKSRAEKLLNRAGPF